MGEKFHVRDNREGGWFFIDNQLIQEYGATIGVYGIAIYNVLAMFANNSTQEAHPSYNTMADLVGCSRLKAVNTVKQLEELGLIKKSKRIDDKGEHSSNTIVLLHKDAWGVSNGGSEDGEERLLHAVVNEDYHVVNDSNQGGTPEIPPSKSGEPGVVNEVNPNKTQLTRLSEKDVVTPSQQTDYRNSLADSVAGICAYDIDAIGSRKRDDIRNTVLYLEKQNATPEQVEAFLSWFVSGRKDGKRFAWPQVVQEDWLKFVGESSATGNDSKPTRPHERRAIPREALVKLAKEHQQAVAAAGGA